MELKQTDIETGGIRYPSPIVIDCIRYFSLALSKIFWRIRYHGTENIPQDRKTGLLVAANHQTYFDPVWLCLPIHRKFRFMAWDKACDWFLIGPAIRYLGAFPVSLEKRGVRRVLNESVRSLRDGATLIVFPEGSREFSNGDFLEFKTGAARAAIEAGVPILPVTICGANHVWAQDMALPRPGKVDIYFHPIIETSGLDASNRNTVSGITARLEEIIASKYNR